MPPKCFFWKGPVASLFSSEHLKYFRMQWNLTISSRIGGYTQQRLLSSNVVLSPPAVRLQGLAAGLLWANLKEGLFRPHWYSWHLLDRIYLGASLSVRIFRVLLWSNSRALFKMVQNVTNTWCHKPGMQHCECHLHPLIPQLLLHRTHVIYEFSEICSSPLMLLAGVK